MHLAYHASEQAIIEEFLSDTDEDLVSFRYKAN